MLDKKRSTKPRNDLTFGYVNSLLEYNPENGILTWRVDRGRNGRIKIGTAAGCLNKKGYYQIGIDGKVYKAHRLAWLLHTREYPKEFIDHINGDKSDNRISNLREATHTENMQNRKRQASKLGETGIYLDKRRNTYQVRLCDNSKGFKHSGCYQTLEEAIQVRDREMLRIKGEFLPETNTNRGKLCSSKQF